MKERQRMGIQHCKLCSKSFPSAKALGGHMRTHLAPLRIPSKTEFKPPQLSDQSDSTSSLASSFEDEEDERESEEKSLVYGLRENPKKSFRVADPQFLDAGFVVVQEEDRESETESTRNPTRKRSIRTRKLGFSAKGEVQETKKPKWGKPSSSDSVSEFEPASLSSISDFSPEEDVALCLMMLSRDSWSSGDLSEFNPPKPGQTLGRYQCQTCKKLFKSSQALGSHRTSHTYDVDSVLTRKRVGATKNIAAVDQQRKHECPFCHKVFGSGQALGGHKRTHFVAASQPAPIPPCAKLGDSLVNSNKFGGNLIDLNLPAEEEEEEEDEDFSQPELSAVSDAEFINAIKQR